MLFLLACAAPLPDDPLVVRLEWLPGVGEAWEDAEVGLWWALSNLGADPADRGGLTIEAEGATTTFTLDLGAVGFSDTALPWVEDAVAPLREDGAVDVARFLLATLYEPGRYYAITGACTTLPEWQARLDAEPLEYAVTVSQLTPGDRLVRFNAATTVERLAWEAGEGEGSLAAGDFVAAEHEVVDLMPNGQQRYAVYDHDGALIAAAATTAAGQPGRCMWCHELTVQRGTEENPSAAGYLDYAAFIAEVDAATTLIEGARTSSVITFGDYTAHEHAEVLTRTFLTPTTDRVALEWGVSPAVIAGLGLPTHTDPELPEWGPVYTRADVDAARRDREPEWEPPAHAPDDRELEAERSLGELPGCP